MVRSGGMASSSLSGTLPKRSQSSALCTKGAVVVGGHHGRIPEALRTVKARWLNLEVGL